MARHSLLPLRFLHTLSVTDGRRSSRIQQIASTVLVRRESIDVIENGWFQDWESFAPWELGVRSFADFALYRAEVPTEVDWRKYLIRQDRRTGLEIEQCLDPTYAPFMLPSFTEQYELPPMVFIETHPWPRALELAHMRANEIGGDLARAWYDILSGTMDV